MAREVEISCTVCGKNVLVAHGRESFSLPPPICSSCDQARMEDEKQRHLAGLQELGVEERLRRLEGLAYDHEGVPHGYQPSPRY
jgi:hypothetical protein